MAVTKAELKKYNQERKEAKKIDRAKHGGGFLHDRQAYNEQLSNYTPSQENAQESSLTSALNRLGNVSLPGDQLQSQIQPFDFEPIERSARANFHQNTIPTLAERFTSMGNNKLSSPTFINQLSQSGAGLEGELARLAAEYGLTQQNQNLQQQQINQNERTSQTSNLFNLLSAGLNPRFENIHHKGSEAGWKGALKDTLAAGREAGLAYLTGGASLAAGGLRNRNKNTGNDDSTAPVSNNQIGSGFKPTNSYGFSFNENSNLGGRSQNHSALLNSNKAFGSSYPTSQQSVIDSILNSYRG